MCRGPARTVTLVALIALSTTAAHALTPDAPQTVIAAEAMQADAERPVSADPGEMRLAQADVPSLLEAHAADEDPWMLPYLDHLSAAGRAAPVHAQAEPEGPRLARFGASPETALFITAYNARPYAYDGELVLDAEALDLSDGMIVSDAATGFILPLEIADGVARAEIPIRARQVAVLQIGPPETIARTARSELHAITTQLREAEREMDGEAGSRVTQLRAEIIGTIGPAPESLTRDTISDLVALYNDPQADATIATGETVGQALLRAALLSERTRSVEYAPVAMRTSVDAVAGEETEARLYADGSAVANVVFLLRDADGLREIDTEFTWPEEGYERALVDVIGVGVEGGRGAVALTYDLRPALEVALETLDPSAPLPERTLTARCHNNSSRLRHMRMRIETPDDRWARTPAQWREFEVRPGETVETEFRVMPPEGAMRMDEFRLVAEEEAERLEATAVGLCGGPEELEVNLARAEGVEVSVSSSYPGYSPEPINNGLLWPADVHWTDHAWASEESEERHWIRFDWPEPQIIERVIVYWNIEDGRVYAPEVVVVEVMGDEVWMPLGEAEPAPGEAATTILLSPTQTDSIRITQPAGMGSVYRPNLMWVTEVQVGR